VVVGVVAVMVTGMVHILLTVLEDYYKPVIQASNSVS
jgi:hypothetical protein